MLQAKFSAWDSIFFNGKWGVEEHTCMGSFENEGKISIVITPYGKLNTVLEEKCFSTFEDCKVAVIDEADEIYRAAKEQAEAVRNMTAESVVQISNEAPGSEEK